MMVSRGSARATVVARALGRGLWMAHKAWSSTVEVEEGGRGRGL